MKRVLQMAGLLAMFACGESMMAPLAPIASDPVLSAAPVTAQQTVTVSWKAYNQCVPEWIQLEGTANVVGHATRTSDGWYQVIIHFQFQGVNGIGETTGDAYRVTLLSHEVINAIASETLPYEDHLNQHQLLVRLSDGASWAVKALWQVTVKPDGTVAVLIDEFSVTCGP